MWRSQTVFFFYVLPTSLRVSIVTGTFVSAESSGAFFRVTNKIRSYLYCECASPANMKDVTNKF